MATIKQTQLLAREESSGGTAMHWIGGQWLDSGEHRESINPATGEVIGSYAKGGRKEAGLAVNAALRAFRETDWKDNRSLRARVLNAMAARFEARAEHLAQLLATEVGKVLPDARFETATVPFNLRFNAALALTEYGRAAEVGEDSLSIVIRQPVGVAGIFAPWNAPIALGIRSLAPALAAGCTAAVILPEQTAQVNALISEVISDTDDLSPGVVNRPARDCGSVPNCAGGATGEGQGWSSVRSAQRDGTSHQQAKCRAREQDGRGRHRGRREDHRARRPRDGRASGERRLL